MRRILAEIFGSEGTPFCALFPIMISLEASQMWGCPLCVAFEIKLLA